jgi:hypothetical protein
MSALDSAQVIRCGNTLPNCIADTSKISPQNPIIHRAIPILQLARWRSPDSSNSTTPMSVGLFDYLAPDIVEAIVEGRQPRSMTVKRLLQGVPSDWADQRAAFGFAR